MESLENRAHGAGDWLVPAAVGCVTGLVICLTLGDRVIPNADEGIYLQGGASVLRGALPYRDFFALTGPGNFWLVAALFQVFGVTLRSARLLTAFDISLMTGLSCWLVSRFAGRAMAVGTAVLVAAICLSSPGNAVVNHRWDSSAFALAAVCAGLYAMETLRHRAAALAGALAVLAAWITPSTGLVALVIIVRLGMERRTRELAPSCVGGAAWAALLPAVVLQYRHALIPMLESLYWAATNYSQANRSGYGAVFGGVAGLFAGAHGGQLPARVLLLTPFLLPALLPPLMAIAWLPALRNPWRPEVYLLLCGGALVGSAYPRWDLLHLLYVSPLFLVLAAVWLERARWGMGRAAIFLLLFIPAGAMCARSLMGDGAAVTLETPAGRVQVSREGALPLQMCLAHVRAGSSLFVFPYEPVFYFLTGGENPTRYPWLQPGMMSAE